MLLPLPAGNCVRRAYPDADELEWYVPAGIGLPDLRRALAVIEQFESSPLDLGGKRASQLLRKKKRRTRRRARQRPRHTSADSEGSNSSGGEEGARPNKARTARAAREREAYKSAQFIEDSDEEYGRDIDVFFAREAELRERTALAAVDSALGTGTMRATGTKKRRRRTAQAGDADGGGGTRQTKRRAVLAPSQRDNSDAQSESQALDDAGEQLARRPPKPRPRYGGNATATTIAHPEGETAFLAPEDVSMSHDVGDQGRNVSDAEDVDDVENDESKNHRTQGGGGAEANESGPRKGRSIVSDEDE